MIYCNFCVFEYLIKCRGMIFFLVCVVKGVVVWLVRGLGRDDDIIDVIL